MALINKKGNTQPVTVTDTTSALIALSIAGDEIADIERKVMIPEEWSRMKKRKRPARMLC